MSPELRWTEVGWTMGDKFNMISDRSPSLCPFEEDSIVGILLRRKREENMWHELLQLQRPLLFPQLLKNLFFRCASTSSTYPPSQSVRSVSVSETSQSVETTLWWPPWWLTWRPTWRCTWWLTKKKLMYARKRS